MIGEALWGFIQGQALNWSEKQTNKLKNNNKKLLLTDEAVKRHTKK